MVGASPTPLLLSLLGMHAQRCDSHVLQWPPLSLADVFVAGNMCACLAAHIFEYLTGGRPKKCWREAC